MSTARVDDELFRAIFDGTMDALFLADDDGVYVDANLAAAELLGVPREEILGQSITAFLSPSFDFEPAWSEFLEAGSQCGEFELYRPDGEIRTVEFAARANIGPGVHLSAIRDITDRRRVEEMLRMQNERFEEYSATMSHDLRGPMAVAMGWIDITMEEDSTDELPKAKAALERMEELVTNLRTLGRYGQTVQSPVETDLADIIDEAWQNVDTGAATLVCEDDPGTISGERGRLLQLFESLFGNAIEYGSRDPHSGGEPIKQPVTVRIGRLDDGFYVEDDGPGIPETMRQQAFEFGYTSRDGAGGLGLAIVDAVADAHGWEYCLTDAEYCLTDADPHGARFEFRPRWLPSRDS